jgi:hypothetical protein
MAGLAGVWLPIATGLTIAALLLSERAMDRASAEETTQRVAVAPARPQRPISLRDRLVVGLQARLASEVQFVERVAQRVQTGHLPQRVVDETFFWARQRASIRRPGRARRPIIFFEPAMRARADRLGVEL